MVDCTESINYSQVTKFNGDRTNCKNQSVIRHHRIQVLGEDEVSSINFLLYLFIFLCELQSTIELLCEYFGPQCGIMIWYVLLILSLTAPSARIVLRVFYDTTQQK